MKSNIPKNAALAAFLIIVSAAAAVAAAPFTAGLFVFALSGGRERVPFAGGQMSQSSDPVSFCIDYAGGLVSSGHGPALALEAATIALAILALIAYRNFSSPSRDVDAGILGRQASVTSNREIRRNSSPWDGKSAPESGVALGTVGRASIVLPANHAAICSPSGGGKTRGSVYPTIDVLSFTGENNLLVTDPSLEIYITAGACLRERGYIVSLLDFESPRQGARYNPLKLISDLADDGDTAAAEARAREVGATLFPAQGNENDIFVNAAGGVFSAVAYIVATSDGVPGAERHMWSVVKTITEGTVGGPAAFKDWLRSFGADSPAVSMAATFLSAEGKLESSILSSLHDGLAPFSSMNMRWLTSASDLDIDAMVAGRSAVFIHTMGPGSPTNRIAALFFAQHWAEVQRLGKRRGLRPCWVVGDEWHSVPRFDLVHALEQARKYGLHYIMYVQSLSGFDQYKTAKEDGKDAILANCDVKALYKAGSDQDARYFEAISGFKTVRVKNEGESRNGSGSGSSQGFSEQKVPVWPMGDILERNPQADGVLVFRQAGSGRDSVKMEVPMREVTETFTAGHFGTLGTREFERAVMGEALDALEARAARIPLEVGAWTPDLAASKSDGTRRAEVLEDEFAAWD